LTLTLTLMGIPWLEKCLASLQPWPLISDLENPSFFSHKDYLSLTKYRVITLCETGTIVKQWTADQMMARRLKHKMLSTYYCWRRHNYVSYTVNHKKRDILFLTITLANLNRFLQFYIILIVKKFYMRLK